LGKNQLFPKTPPSKQNLITHQLQLLCFLEGGGPGSGAASPNPEDDESLLPFTDSEEEHQKELEESRKWRTKECMHPQSFQSPAEL
tara:strand:+ start:173 stop:430 length:258 start_codon:yes stop_codon:yes gene_type:complete